MTEPINNLGVIVNEKEGQIKELTLDEAVIPVRVPDSIFDRFVRAAQHYNYPNVEAWAAATLVQSLESRVGQPSISAPSQVTGQSTGLIKGPSNSGMVRRA